MRSTWQNIQNFPQVLFKIKFSNSIIKLFEEKKYRHGNILCQKLISSVDLMAK